MLTFVKVSSVKAAKWKKSTKNFQASAIAEEHARKIQKLQRLRSEINAIYDEVRQNCSSFRYLCFLHAMTELHRELYVKTMVIHAKKLSRLIHKEYDVDKYIDNRSSYNLSFFEKLVLCRGLEFSLPSSQTTKDTNDTKASFEKAYWRLDFSLEDNQKELTTATLRPIAFNYIEKKGPGPPRSL